MLSRCREISYQCLTTFFLCVNSNRQHAGVITGLLAQHMKVYEGTVLGVYLHACGGDAARERRGAYSVLAEDLTEGIAACIKKTEKGR